MTRPMTSPAFRNTQMPAIFKVRNLPFSAVPGNLPKEFVNEHSILDNDFLRSNDLGRHLTRHASL